MDSSDFDSREESRLIASTGARRNSARHGTSIAGTCFNLLRRNHNGDSTSLWKDLKYMLRASMQSNALKSSRSESAVK
jgi:hypothetical protein